MHRLPNLQLDNPQCMQILRPETAPGAIQCENGTTVPGTGAQQPGCTFLLLCGILWLVLRQCCQRIPRPGRRKRKGQGPHDPKGGKLGPHSGNSSRVRPSQRGVPEPARPTAQRSQRSAPTRSQARFGDCETKKSRGESAEMQGSPEAGRGSFAFCPRRKGGVRLRVESRPGSSHARPTTAGTPPGGVRLDLILRGHGRPTRHATAVRPASGGGARRSRGRRCHRGETTQGRPLRCTDPSSPGEGHPRQSRLGKQTSSQCSIHSEAHALPRGRQGQGKGKEKEQEEEKKDGDGLSQEETQAASTSEVARQLASQAQGQGRANTLLDTPSEFHSQTQDAQMWEGA